MKRDLNSFILCAFKPRRALRLEYNGEKERMMEKFP